MAYTTTLVVDYLAWMRNLHNLGFPSFRQAALYVVRLADLAFCVGAICSAVSIGTVLLPVLLQYYSRWECWYSTVIS